MIDLSLDWLPLLVENELLMAVLVFAGTAMLVAMWMPGVLLPIAASSGALLDVWAGAASVALGALAGSMIIFLTTRRLARDRIPPTIAAFLRRFEPSFIARGAWLVLGLRLVGTPHFLVSSASALTPIRTPSFALATLVGLLPAILAAAFAGAAL